MDIIIEFLSDSFTFFPLVLLSILIITFGLMLIGFIQGREISLWPPRIGQKILHVPTEINEQKITTYINQKRHELNELSDLNNNSNPDSIGLLSYKPPEISNRLKYVLSAMMDINSKIKKLGHSHGGGWPGISMAGVGTFIKILDDEKLLTDSFHKSYGYLNYLLIPHVSFGENINDRLFLEIQILIFDLHRTLEDIPKGEFYIE